MAAQQWATEALSRSAAYVQDNKTASVIAGVGALAGVTYFLTRKRKGYHSKPTSFELSGGSLGKGEVEDSVRLITSHPNAHCPPGDRCRRCGAPPHRPGSAHTPCRMPAMPPTYQHGLPP